MATKAAYKRLTKEYLNIQKSPPPLITAKPLETNILEWHYVLLGPKDTPYEGGQYHGKLTFPPEYPYKPPSIRMITPSGRFTPNARICLSMSDYHPSTWNPGWSVATVLNGLLSFMVSDESAAGTMKCDEDERRRLARHSWDFNKNSKIFQEVFPDLISSCPPLSSASDNSLLHLDSSDSSLRNRFPTSFTHSQESTNSISTVNKVSGTIVRYWKRLLFGVLVLWSYLVVSRVMVRLGMVGSTAGTGNAPSL